VREDEIMIVKIFKGSIKLEWIPIYNHLNRDEIAHTQQILQLLNSRGIKSDIIRRGFVFRLSENDFDEDGNFNSFNSSSFERGPKGKSEKYTQPSNDWYRLGLRVLKGKYPNTNDNWLGSNNNPEEWYVAYHGIRIPGDKVMQGISSIMN
jgi:hypothetical protein